MQIQYEITSADHLEKIKAVRPSLAARSARILLDIFGLSLGVLTYLYFDQSLGVAVISVFAVVIILHIFLPFIIHRRVYSRNLRLYGMRTVTFDNEGLKCDSEIAHVEIKWSSFEKFKETENLFLTYQTRDLVGIVPKRAFPSQEAVAQFRSLLASKVRRD